MTLLALWGVMGLWSPAKVYAQPPNDNCINASPILAPGGVDIGFQYGTFYSDTVSLVGATLETFPPPPEYFPPAQITAGNNQKSVWYRFKINTTRQVQIILKEYDATPLNPLDDMPSSAAGWTLYRAPGYACFPNASQVVDPPIINIEGYTHKCLTKGEYLIQVAAELFANGQIFIQLKVGPSSIPGIFHDDPTNWRGSAPLNFGLASGTHGYLTPYLNQTYEISCHSYYPTEMSCDTLPGGIAENMFKTTWHKFTTDNHVDHLRFEVQEVPWNPLSTVVPRRWVYRLYKGDVELDSIPDGIPDNGENLTPVGSCRLLHQNSSGAYGAAVETCNLDPNTTYSIQLYSHVNYTGTINVRLYEVGAGDPIAPDPGESPFPTAVQFGVLPLSVSTKTDIFSCNSRMSNYTANCPGIYPPSGYFVSGSDTFRLGGWMTFETSIMAHLNFSVSSGWSPQLLIRIYNGDIAAPGGCSNLTLYDEFRMNSSGFTRFDCFPQGKYSVLIMGIENHPRSTANPPFYPNADNPDPNHWYHTHLAKTYTMKLQPVLVSPGQLYDLDPQATDVGYVNSGNPLVSGNNYMTGADYYDCDTTRLPEGNVCGPTVDRAIYRLVNIGQNGILTVGQFNWWRRIFVRLYRGNATTEPIVNGRVQNLVDQAGCHSHWWPGYFRVCVTPGWYTLVSFGDAGDIGYGDNLFVRFESFGPTLFTDPLNPEVLPAISLSNPTSSATPSRFYCTDNPMTITIGSNSYPPCANTTKQIYREIYLSDDFLTTFSPHSSSYYSWWWDGIYYRIFRGRLSDHLSSGPNPLTSLYKDCRMGGFKECMEAGWYTIVAYGTGKTFPDPTYTSGFGGSLGLQTWFTFSIDTNKQKFGTFATADRTYQNSPIAWGPNGGHTAQIPRNHKTFTFPSEYWECKNNLPFPPGITPCPGPTFNRVSYRVFTLDKPSHVLIDNLGGVSYRSRLYQGDITALSPPYTVTHECIYDDLRACLPAGTYTLVTFAGDQHIGSWHTPRIYVDSLGTSKFDFPHQAYNFGLMPNDAIERRGAIADPPGPFGRAPSNDFFFCTTGADPRDPIHVCPIGKMPPPNPLPQPTNPRRTLWYTFTVNGPGIVYVSVYNLTQGKGSRSPFAVYKSNSTTFPHPDPNHYALTTASPPGGLEFVVSSTTWWCGNLQTVSFLRDPCTATGTDRYYVLVDNNYYNEPNVQIEVGIKFAPAPPFTVLYNHYSEANVITSATTPTCYPPYTSDTLATGTFVGCPGNLTCATMDPPDQNTCGTRTIWYTFEAEHSGSIFLQFDNNGSPTFNNNDVYLFKQVVPGDSTSSGLVRVTLTGTHASHPNLGYTYWGRGCLEPGRYYIMFTGCTNPTATVVPRIWLVPNYGDMCVYPGEINIDTTSGTFTETLNVDCHGIGESPGEDGSNMQCLGTPIGIKSQWVKINVNVQDTVDIDIELTEYTTTTPDQIRYRVAMGDCNAMTFDNCVTEGTFIILNLKCRLPGTYWIHSVLPQFASGTIQYKVTISPSVDTACNPLNPERPQANFNFVAACVDEPVIFTNYSTTGSDMTYHWDFGNNSTSTDPNPIYMYPSPGTYLVRLSACRDLGDTTLCDTFYRTLSVFTRPTPLFNVPDTVIAGEPITLVNLSTNTIASSNYQWNFCAAPGVCGSSMLNSFAQNPPPVTYNTPGTKTICLTVYNGICIETYCDTFKVFPAFIYGGGPYDGFSISGVYPDCSPDIFTGGPYDGVDLKKQVSTCTENIWVGGPYDGFADGFAPALCLPDIFTGGPYDGTDTKKQVSTCTENIWVGGPYDGFASSGVFPDCFPDIFTGGPYDGTDTVVVRNQCIVTTMWSGGPYDGHGDAAVYNCPLPPNIFVGGPYDGFAESGVFPNCLPDFFTGGPYDGTDYDKQITVCTENIWVGGPYDGFAELGVYPNCLPDFFTGGPYDGTDYDKQITVCTENIWVGGPYDGFAELGVYPNCLPDFFTGGPYDGTQARTQLGTCYENIWVGGPYDGFSEAVRDYTTLASGSAVPVCQGDVCPLTANTVVEWYDASTGGTLLHTGITYVTPPLYETRVYWFKAVCAPGSTRYPVVAQVLGSLNPTFTYIPGCYPNIPATFVNTTIITNRNTPSLGVEITNLGTTGLPPGISQVSFQSGRSGTPNFANLIDGVNNAAWYGNGATAGTQWVQWRYLQPKSVYRITYTNNSVNPGRSPKLLRLYYTTGGPWVLAKAIIPPYPSGGNFDSGLIFETDGIFATRWMLLVDVEAQGPEWTEFQVHAGYPTIGAVGGRTAFWDFDDMGATSTANNPSHLFSEITTPHHLATRGQYNVTLTMSGPSLCPKTGQEWVPNMPCDVPLSIRSNRLTAELLPDGVSALLDWQIDGVFAFASFEKLMPDQSWATLNVFGHESFTRFNYTDSILYTDRPNIYRVRYVDFDGSVGYSNLAEVLAVVATYDECKVYPNPVKSGAVLNFDLYASIPSPVVIRIFDIHGRPIAEKSGMEATIGKNTYEWEVTGLSKGMYMAHLEMRRRRYVVKFVVNE